ncbi:MAG: formylglycine-generating enzyme family protein [Opitutaceae bacterium]|nr:formylglycine-generating enzyme family protein [Opitutaceae bacterium]
MNTHNTTQKSALLLATLLITAGAATATGQTTPGSSIPDSLGIGMQMVLVGDAGNTPDPATGNRYGAVSYEYYIGKYEVTNAQYAAFLNAVASRSDPYALYNTSMANTTVGGITRTGTEEEGYTYLVKEGYAAKPVNCVSFYDAARFCNWLTNGQGSGGTESGLYVFDGVNNLVSTPDHAASTGWVIPDEDEWYKAAYYDPDKGGAGIGGYWAYPTQSDSISKNDANYDNYGGNAADYLKDAGSYIEASSYFGTYDQAGNVWERMENMYDADNRVLRGGSYYSGDGNRSGDDGRNGLDPAAEGGGIGFRVAFLTSVPEPGTVAGAPGLAALVFGIWLRHIRHHPGRARRG